MQHRFSTESIVRFLGLAVARAGAVVFSGFGV